MDEELDGAGGGGNPPQSTPRIDGPHLVAAVVCDRVLIEKNETTSLIRLVDQFVFDVPGDLADVPASLVVLTNLFIALKGGEPGQSAHVRVNITRPSGLPEGEVDAPIVLGGTSGIGSVNLIVDLRMNASEEGIYLIDVALDDRIVTRVPIQVVHRRTEPTAALDQEPKAPLPQRWSQPPSQTKP